MSELKFCPECGGKLMTTDRFCGECGFDLNILAANSSSTEKFVSSKIPPPLYTPSEEPRADIQMAQDRSDDTLDANTGGNKKALIIMVSLLAVLFLAGGSIYWWLIQGEEPRLDNSQPKMSAASNNNLSPATRGENEGNVPVKHDLSRAATYLSKPGFKGTFYVNYPDGNAAIVERISGQAVPNESVRVSEVEIGIERGEEYGFGFHYVERADGTYYILDSSPFEIFPVLKNNLTIGQTWNYQDEFGQITWTVVDMGVDLDLGFEKFADCLLLKEDNQAVGWQAITYYAPGHGSVLVISPGGELEYFKMTAITNIDLGLAADMIRKWCPNYNDIKDERDHKY